MTQTRPWPPPGAGDFVAAARLVPFAGAGLAAAGLAAAPEVFGLNKSPRLNLAGDADAAGLAAAVAAAFLEPRFALGEAVGDAAGEGDAAVSPDEAAISDFLCARCFVGDWAGDSPGVGD